MMLNDIKFFRLNNEKENHMLIKVCKNSNNIYDIYNIDIDNQINNRLYTEEKKENEYFNNISLNPFNYNIFVLSGTENNRGVVKIFKISKIWSLMNKIIIKEKKN